MFDIKSHQTERRARILLVDDTEINRDLIGGILRAADFDVDFACNGEAAYEATWGTTYDLVLMDVEMPGMNGFETAARIRAREGAMAGVRIAALTATKKPGAEHYSFWSGIDEFITRPTNPRELVQRISEILAAPRSHSNDWKAVWRLAPFKTFTERLDEEETESYLAEMRTRLKNVLASIDAGTTRSGDFALSLHKLLDLATVLGFDEVAGVCRLYREGRGVDGRSRDANLLGSVERALFAINSYRGADRKAGWTSLWARARTNVNNLIHGTAVAV